MASLQHVYRLSIFLLLITFSMETCDVRYLQENFSNFTFMEDGTYIFEGGPISLIQCIDTPEINSTIFDDVKSKLNNVEDFRYLSLYGNDISSINGCGFETLSHLVYLELSHNNIEMLSQSVFNNLVNLKILDLSQNKIKFVEDNFMVKMDRLQLLDLKNNYISEINFLHYCPKLKILDLSDNKIVNLSANFLTFSPELVYLNMSGNEIVAFNAYSLPNLMFLHISNNKLRTIDTEATLPKLELLNLGNNALLFNEIYNAYNHNYNNNRKSYVTTMLLFKNIPLLNTLILTNTGINQLEIGTFTGLGQLKILDLSHNEIKELQNGIFYELNSLKKLYINDNQITRFFYDYNFMLDEIDLNENDWRCGDLLELLKLIPNTKIIRGDPFEEVDGPGTSSCRTNFYGIACILR